MSVATLDSLLLDFEKARAAQCGQMQGKIARSTSAPILEVMAVGDRIRSITPDFCAYGSPLQMHYVSRDMVRTGTIYCIARDQSMEAAMLWKLSN